MEINNQQFNPKYSLRSMFVFEQISGKAFIIETLLDTYIFCYACLVANPENPSLEFDDFIDWCDGHPEVMDEFNKFIETETKKRNMIGGDKKKVKKARTPKNSR